MIPSPVWKREVGIAPKKLARKMRRDPKQSADGQRKRRCSPVSETTAELKLR